MKARWQMGYVIPRLVFLVFLADVELRLLPLDTFTFRGWEAMKRYRTPGAPFEPNRQYHNAEAYGDLAAIGNLPDLRQYREEWFSTDPLGFRNPPGLTRSPMGAILIGDSFAVGSGVNDEETLAARLGELLGCGIYNAGGIDPDPDRILALARKLNLQRALVLQEYNEDFEMPAVPTKGRRKYQAALGKTSSWTGALVGRVRGLLTVSPLKIVSERGLKRLENGRILPNRYAGNVVRGTLRNGDPMLLLSSHVEQFHRQREVPTAYWKWFRKELQEGGSELVVVLVPSKYRVYRRFLADPRNTPSGDGGSDYLDRVEKELRESGIPTLNLTEVLLENAAKRLEDRVYLYWLDDLHWNRQGIEIASVAIRDRWADKLSCPARDPLEKFRYGETQTAQSRGR